MAIRYLDEEPSQKISTNRKITYLDDDLPTVKKASIKKTNPYARGPMGYGVEAVKRGLSFSDVPHILAKAGSGAFMGAPEQVAKNPRSFAMGGMIGANLGREKNDRIFPKATSEGGEMIGKVAEIATGLIPSENIIMNAGKFIPKGIRTAKSLKNVQKQRALSEELLFNIEKARKDVGATQASLIDVKGAERVDPERLKKIIDSLPQALKDEIATNPELKMEVINRIEQGQFVMGGASKQVSPQVTRLSNTKIKKEVPSLAGRKKYQSVRGAAGRYGRELKRDIITPKKFVEIF